MEAHEHHQPATTNNEHWLKRHRWLTYAALGILGYFSFIEHREHIWPLLPWLILLACPFMHMFMHGGHKHGGHSHDKNEEKKQ